MNYSKLKTIIEITTVFVFSFVCLFLTMDRVINIYDEGVILTGAMRVNAGDIPHRDFYVMYGPAEFYLLSWLFDIFGQSVIVERVFDLVIRAGIVTIVYASLTLYCRKTIAIFAAVICALSLSFVGHHGYPVYPALLLTIGSSMILLQIFARNTSVLYPLLAGLLTGLAALFRYDVGFFAFIAHIFAAILILSQSKHGQNKKVRYIFHKLMPYVLASGVPVVAMLIWYGFNGALYSFIHDVITFPSENYNRTRGLPFPWRLKIFIRPTLWVIYLPIVIACFALLSFLKRDFLLSKSYPHSSISDVFSRTNGIEFLIVFSLLTIMFYLKGIVRVGAEQLQLALIPSMMILALLMEISITNTRWFKVMMVTLAAISCVATLTLSYQRAPMGKPNFIKVRSPNPSYINNFAFSINLKGQTLKNNFVLSDVPEFYKLLSSSGISKIEVDSVGPPVSRKTSAFFVDPDREAAIRFIVQNTSPDERIFIGLSRHDIVFWNDVSSYFQANRLPATKWHHFDPGLQTSAKIQSEIIDDLERNKPGYIWLESTWENHSESNESVISSGVTILDEYIRGKYKLDRNFGQISVWRLKNF